MPLLGQLSPFLLIPFGDRQALLEVMPEQPADLLDELRVVLERLECGPRLGCP
jgi:hypothetical protein